MTTRPLTYLLGALALVAPFLIPSTAEAASLSSCGNVFVAGEAHCEVYVEGGCVAMCEPVSVQASCAADLKVNCDGMCTGSASVECKGSCEGDCQARCSAVEPGEFSCAADCQASCSADCSGRCAAESDQAHCEASCKATCSGSCDAECEVTPPSANCEASCQASCEGSCHGQANIDCQVDCQASGFAECEADLEGGCEAQCMKPDGALFCDGQFVNTSNLKDCVAAIQAALGIEVYANGSASCEGNSCMAEGEIGCSCTADGSGDPALAGLFGLGLVVAIRRRRR